MCFVKLCMQKFFSVESKKQGRAESFDEKCEFDHFRESDFQLH